MNSDVQLGYSNWDGETPIRGGGGDRGRKDRGAPYSYGRDLSGPTKVAARYRISDLPLGWVDLDTLHTVRQVQISEIVGRYLGKPGGDAAGK